jgi:MYXO-CTERM domain-containing protein
MRHILSVLGGLSAYLPAAALACGGLFCNTAQPVNQSAERILFAQDGDQVEMVVQIQYQGPPTDFGWLLPTGADVETTLSSEQLFALMDQRFAPIFRLNTDWGNCPPPPVAESDGDGGPGGGRNGGVNVLSREAVGPYDRAILQADNVGVLREWLDANAFGIPDGVDAKLQPYIDAGAAFVALKLLPGNDAGDVTPLRLRFTAPLPAVPILPTGVAAEPDMGVIVHLVAANRAIPTNYRHLRINEAAIDWVNQGSNYAAVVSQAADEAGGKGFTTDFAGPHDQLQDALRPLTELQMDNLRAAATLEQALQAIDWMTQDADLARILGDGLEPPEGVDLPTFLQCPQCYDAAALQQAVDGPALADRAEAEVNAPRVLLGALLGANPYLTRLYTTMSADEMNLDPVFDFNGDLDPVPQVRTATRFVQCDENAGPTGPDIIGLGNGVRFALDEGQVPDAIQRDRGETVRGDDVPAAAVIEQMSVAGQPMVIEDRGEMIRERYQDAPAPPLGGEDPEPAPTGGAGEDPVPGGEGGSNGADESPTEEDDDDGCGCDVGANDGSPAPAGVLLGALALLGLRRRRR